MSLINREDLIAEYDRVHVGPPGGARKLMVDAPEVLPEPKWIPVSERMPDEGVHILISIPDGVTYGWFNGCYFIQDVAHNNKRLRVVEAWQPLPEPYREEGGE